MLHRIDTHSFHNIEAGDGQHLRYMKAGNGPPLILVHTIRTQLDYFRDVVPLLASDFTVYAVDLPGHGQSSIDTNAPYDEPYFRRALITFIETLDLSGATLFGESIGAVLALTVAATIPDRVKAVVASNAYDYDGRYADGVRRGNLFANIAIGSYAIPIFGAINAALENRLFLRWVLEGGLYNNQNLPQDLLAEFDRVGRRRGYRYVERKVLSSWRSWGEARALYKSVEAPIALIYADHDWSRPEERSRNLSELPQAETITLYDTGHFAVLERASRIAEIVANTKNHQTQLTGG